MEDAKRLFITHQFYDLVKHLPAESVGRWGKMNAQQMIEHVADFFRVSTGELKFELVTPAEHLEKYRNFLLSDKMFRENTAAPMLPEQPFAVRAASMNDSLQDLQAQIAKFHQLFTDGVLQRTLHPVFGELDYNEWVLLHYKHLYHHARQFGLLDA
jgi:Protein of unknown function (DUF1569)